MRDIVTSGELQGQAVRDGAAAPSGRAGGAAPAGDGGGKRDNFTACGAAQGGRRGAAGAQGERRRDASRSLLQDRLNEAEAVAAAVEGAILGDYEPDRYKTDKERREDG